MTTITGSGSAQASVAERPIALPPVREARRAGIYIDKSREYLGYALDNEAHAAVTDNPKLKEVFIHIARQYRKLAKQLDAPWEPEP